MDAKRKPIRARKIYTKLVLDSEFQTISADYYYYSGPLTLATTPPTTHVISYRFRNDDNGEASATWVTSTSTPAVLDVDTNYRVRFGFEEQSGNPDKNVAPGVTVSYEGGAWLTVSAASQYVQVTTSIHYTDGDETTQQITSGTTFELGNEGMDNGDGVAGGAGIDIDAESCEVEYCITVVSADVNHEDSIELRIYDTEGPNLFDVYDVSATFTVNKAAPTYDNTATLAAQAALTVDGVLELYEDASLSALAAMAAVGNIDIDAFTSLSAQAAIAAAGGLSLEDSATFSAQASVSADYQLEINAATFPIAARAQIYGDQAILDAVGSATLDALADATAAAAADVLATVILAASGNLTAAGDVETATVGGAVYENTVSFAITADLADLGELILEETATFSVKAEAGSAVAGAYGTYFDSATTILKTSDLTGNADGQRGMVSFWIRRLADVADQYILYASNDDTNYGFRIFIPTVDDTLRIRGRSISGTNVFDVNSGINAIPADGIWHHVLASWNTGGPYYRMYIDDVSNYSGSVIGTNIDYTKTHWRMGSVYGDTNHFKGHISEFYFNNDLSLDIDLEANRRKFIDAEGNPVSLGDDGSLPTGAAPRIYAPDGNPTVNAGDGGHFDSAIGTPQDADGPRPPFAESTLDMLDSINLDANSDVNALIQLDHYEVLVFSADSGLTAAGSFDFSDNVTMAALADAAIASTAVLNPFAILPVNAALSVDSLMSAGESITMDMTVSVTNTGALVVNGAATLAVDATLATVAGKEYTDTATMAVQVSMAVAAAFNYFTNVDFDVLVDTAEVTQLSAVAAAQFNVKARMLSPRTWSDAVALAVALDLAASAFQGPWTRQDQETADWSAQAATTSIWTPQSESSSTWS